MIVEFCSRKSAILCQRAFNADVMAWQTSMKANSKGGSFQLEQEWIRLMDLPELTANF